VSAISPGVMTLDRSVNRCENSLVGSATDGHYGWAPGLPIPTAHQLLRMGKNSTERVDAAPHVTCTNGHERIAKTTPGRFLNRASQVRILPGALCDVGRHSELLNAATAVMADGPSEIYRYGTTHRRFRRRRNA
jgi:hypothetical protein